MGCEAAYRQSGNQRLLIEFALMRLAEKALPQQPDAAPAPPVSAHSAAEKATPAQTPPQQPRAAGTASGIKVPGLSLKDMMSRARENETSGKDSAEILSDEPLTFEGIMNAWQSLAESWKAAGRGSMYTAMTLHSPGIDIDSGTLTFYVSNAAQQDFIREKNLSKMEATMRRTLKGTEQ